MAQAAASTIDCFKTVRHHRAGADDADRPAPRAYRFYFYSHEPSEPPHVHVDSDEASLKAWLEPVILARNRGFRPREINGILALVDEHRDALLEA